MDYMIEKLISEEEISKRIIELANEINNDYHNEDLILVGLLKGSVIFLSDLSRKLTLNCKLDFMIISSYGNNMESSKDVRLLKDLDESIKNKNVLIVEDIIDTGYTLKKVIELLETREPKSLKICTLLDKPEKREVSVNVDYVGFKIPDEFVVGYGIDYAQNHRTLPYIGKVVY